MERVSRTLLAWSVEVPPHDEEEPTPRWIPLAYYSDNVSLQWCPNNNNDNDQHWDCDEQSMQRLVWRILYWLKRIVVRLAHSYHADTAVLLLLPLLMGFWMGIYVGRRIERRETSWMGACLACLPTSWLVWGWERQGGGGEIAPKSTTAFNHQNGNPITAVNVSHATTAAITNCSDKSPLLQLLQAADDHSPTQSTLRSFPNSPAQLASREVLVRNDLQSDRDTTCESGIAAAHLPRHIAFIMDGNRRYGRQVYGNKVAGHWDGSRKLLDVAKWCLAEHIPYVTVYAFSTENWQRDPTEVAALMEIFATYAQELRRESLARNIRVRILSTDPSPIPVHVADGLQRLQEDTKDCTGLTLNVCLSYGSRSEMVHVARSLVTDCIQQGRDPSGLAEKDISDRLLTRDSPDPDILVRTSGEMRISNYLLWQLAYAELFFLDKNWPELQKDDFLQVIRSYAHGRNRRFGK